MLPLRMTHITRRAVFAAVAGATAISVAGLGAGAASAAPGDNLPDSCLEYSADGNTGWSTDANATIDWTGNKPSPGSDVVNGSTYVRNVCDTPAKFQVYAGYWSVGGGSAYLRADIGSSNGNRVDVKGDPGILVAEKSVSKNTPVSVVLHVGIPKEETKQGFAIKPAWSFVLEETTPGGNDGGNDGSGSLDGVLDGILGGFGSLGDGSSTGSLSKIFSSATTSGTVTAGR